MLRERYRAAATFEAFVAGAERYPELWRAMAERAAVPDELVERVRALGARRRLLVLLEDWCLDAVGAVPYLAALARAAPNVELRVLGRDDNPDLMDAHLTNGSRSVPVVMVLDEEYRELGWWGPRPRELQRWVREEGLALPTKERYRVIRGWHARDRGRATLEEVVALLERTRDAVTAAA